MKKAQSLEEIMLVTTERLIIRSFRHDDWQALLEYASDSEAFFICSRDWNGIKSSCHLWDKVLVNRHEINQNLMS
ncbi:hypothetical protein [Paenibacillus ginsengarvi]|uniref:hypothetical protein n=1 Tax=Paenibacillus ginsengarvi TaxID=400777 RepID=UPI0011C37ABF|nr:hypothetical protein [Paenibacillus ginsengarvi]